MMCCSYDSTRGHFKIMNSGGINLKHLKKVLENLEQAKILDIATGSGGFLSILSGYVNKPVEGVGVDQSSKAIELAKEKHAGEPFVFEVMDSENLLFEAEAFDIVGVSNSLHHFSDVKKALSEMVRVLKPGGYLIVYEMISDNQTEKQMTHVLFHHFWAEIDTRLGISHNETYTQDGLSKLLGEVQGATIIDKWICVEEDQGENEGDGKGHGNCEDKDVDEDKNQGVDANAGKSINTSVGANNARKVDLSDEQYSAIANSLTNYIDRAKGFEDIKELEVRAEKLKERLITVGFESATEWIVVLKKND
jgi:ubiquinone/menaquinone biosynthesis C-methylase UbiE